MSTSFGTKITSMRGAVGEIIVGPQKECEQIDRQTAFQLYIVDLQCFVVCCIKIAYINRIVTTVEIQFII